jgi:hypothetical protein
MPGKEVVTGIFSKNKVVQDFNEKPKQKRTYSATVRFRTNSNCLKKIEITKAKPQLLGHLLIYNSSD